MNKINSLIILLISLRFSCGVLNSFGEATFYKNSANCSTPLGGDYSLLVRSGMCWSSDDRYFFHAISFPNDTLLYQYQCDFSDCSACNLNSNFTIGSCKADYSHIGNYTIAQIGVTSVTAQFIGAYFHGDSSCNIDNLSEIEGMELNFCILREFGYASPKTCSDNVVTIYNCTDQECQNCPNVLENITVGECVNSSFGYYGYTKFFCGSYSPFGFASSTSSTTSLASSSGVTSTSSTSSRTTSSSSTSADTSSSSIHGSSTKSSTSTIAEAATITPSIFSLFVPIYLVMNSFSF